MSERYEFGPAQAAGCGTCGRWWLGASERQCDCAKREPPPASATITAVDRATGTLTVDGLSRDQSDRAMLALAAHGFETLDAATPVHPSVYRQLKREQREAQTQRRARADARKVQRKARQRQQGGRS